ncbi:MAG: hypothetical protein A2092_10935 [Rhodobacteraceae bacterium GWE1_64_9]|nr:MAG: hypothetical protein A2092_10935 [Rhodobacteraceae bacterium GWE1_64_9]OHC50632.1 MAG: hypothetical protein A2X69_18510 [Rhodobacteraceae bacterium GWF1_65_7]HBD89920.1 YjbH domain-containing protein [Gemmobacter sp.]HBU16306.1 YjbH domain-containing protein [Gemmobacter sp.]
MTTREISARKYGLLMAPSLLSLCIGLAAQAEEYSAPSLNFYGVSGMIDMPSAEMQEDGLLTATSAHFGPVSRNTLSFQLTPRIAASFRFLGIRDWNAKAACAPNCGQGDGIDQFDTYYDRSFDIRYLLLKEGEYLPAVTIGLQDFAGTGVLSGEYLVATKNFGPSFKATVGLGWGRLGSYGSIGSPFGDRAPIDVGEGGNVNYDQWFRGPAAPFAGIEWSPGEKWTLKAEYSSDAYETEAEDRGTFERKSPLNFGVEYEVADRIRLGAYYLYGSEIGIAAQFALDPRTRPAGGINTPAPEPVKQRPSRASDPEAWSAEWVTQADAGPILMRNLDKRLSPDGIVVESLGYTGSVAQLRIRNTKLDAEAQAVGRAARALSQVMPASVETFEIVPLNAGVAAAKITVRRSDLERLETSPTAMDSMRSRVGISGAGPELPGTLRNDELYPRFRWSLAPALRLRLFDQNDPLKYGLGARVKGDFDIARGLTLSGSITKSLAGNLDERPPVPGRELQPVRSANYIYDSKGDPALETLALHWRTTLGQDLYGRVSFGYLERMFGGISTEVLWKPADRRWAIGAEINYVAQRAPDQGLGFTLPQSLYQTDETGTETGPSSYRLLTGHVSGYYALDNGFNLQLDVGRYLAGDVGATFTVEREFGNGWRVGAFATKTDVSAEEFGSGSFDKGIKLEIPFAWATGSATRKTAQTVLRPFGRDGGQRLELEGRLYETVREYQATGLDQQWGRFWK